MKNTRNTKQKRIVLDYLEKHKNRHITIEEIQKELDGEVGTTTIYRIINKLVEIHKDFVINITKKKKSVINITI